MRRLILLFISLLTVIACEKVDENLTDLSKHIIIDDDNFNVSMNEALLFAKSLRSENDDENPIKDVKVVSFNSDTLLYLIDFDKKGWAVISGDKRTAPLIAFDEHSEEDFNLDNINQGVFFWLDEKAEMIYGLKNQEPQDSTLEINPHWAAKKMQMIIPPDGDGFWQRVLINTSTQTLPSYQVGPLMVTKWGQGEPWNTCVPFGEAINGVHERCVTGCVAVATAQIMYYGHYKSNKPSWMYEDGSCIGYSWDGYKNYSFSFSNGTSDVWDDMLLNGAPYGYPGAHEVAILQGYVGYRINMNYSLTSSGAHTEDVPGLLDDFGITCNYQGYDYSKVISNLNNNKPVYADGCRTRIDHTLLGVHLYYTYENCHAWVIDGYEDKKWKTTYTYEWQWIGDGYPSTPPDPSIYEGKIETSTSYYSTRYFIMNWGWDGSGDTGRYLPNGSWNPGNGDYKYERSILCDFSF